ncbi:ABC-type transport auxiliary lipoprotein family protein [Thiorhodospira sibirica]|uniref:ABC-type transport auxiliary lipoprotein family protein n=1 Tax=Thiorhodospira sibirica TaxID=154347 RepID=UPI00022C2298|nr:ABC-type transport auxiliary lipoprotein family protein [Thiorhodospira sibirica]
MLSCLLRSPYFLLIVVLLTGLGGCSVALDRTPLERHSYLLLAEHPAPIAPAEQGLSLAVGAVNVAAPFNGRNFIYRTDALNYVSDYYRYWLSAPRDQFSTLTVQWLRASGLFAHVQIPGMAHRADYRLDLDVSRFYIDLAEPEQAHAVLHLAAYLSKPRSPEYTIQRFSYALTVPLQTEADPIHAKATAFNQVLVQALQALEQDLAQHLQ